MSKDCYCENQLPCSECGVTPACQNCWDWWGCMNCSEIARMREQEIYWELPDRFQEMVIALAPVMPVLQVIKIFEASLSEDEREIFEFRMIKDYENIRGEPTHANMFKFKDQKFLSTEELVWKTVKFVKDRANELAKE